MFIEERLEKLETDNALLRMEVEALKARSAERFVTPTQLAELMGVNVNTVHKKIREGEVKVTRKLGDPRIPMSQFAETETPAGVIQLVPREKKKKELSIKAQIFGD